MTIGKIIKIVGLALSVLYFILCVMMLGIDKSETGRIIWISALICTPLPCIFIYGFGELVENSQIIREKMEESNVKDGSKTNFDKDDLPKI
ncbi:MAG: hypothetical protein PHY11_03115 [Bacilli bacterium]|nr:hypothetical protein [Bacilli bacterium]MDD3422707.1 hypothetical protein [Bacilli bacterium]MDD4065968.1 hypothetical protein [Bacilli bacterium]